MEFMSVVIDHGWFGNSLLLLWKLSHFFYENYKKENEKKSRKSYRCSPCNICISLYYVHFYSMWLTYIYKYCQGAPVENHMEKLSGSMFILVSLGLVVPFRSHIWREEHDFLNLDKISSKMRVLFVQRQFIWHMRLMSIEFKR